jgi:hypothetical protein
VDQVADGLDVSVDTGGTGALRGTIALEGPTGRAVIAVGATVLPRVAQPDPHPPAPATAPAAEAPAEALAEASAAAPASVAPTPAPATPAPAAAKVAKATSASAEASPASVMSPPTSAPAPHGAPSLTTSVTAEANRAPSTATGPSAPAPERETPPSERRAARAQPAEIVTRRPPVFFSAALGLLLVVLCIDAVVLLSNYNSPGMRWAAVVVSGLGLVAVLGDVRKSAIASSVLLWNLGLSLVYWISIEVFASSTLSAATLSAWEHTFVAVCAVAAAGDAVLFAWAMSAKTPPKAMRWRLAVFAGLTGVAWLTIALAWALQASSAHGLLWYLTGGITIAAILAGLFVGQAWVRVGLAGPAAELAGERAERLSLLSGISPEDRGGPLEPVRERTPPRVGGRPVCREARDAGGVVVREPKEFVPIGRPNSLHGTVRTRAC